MKQRLVCILGLVAFGHFAVQKASADTFALNVDFCSSPCLVGNTGTGAVTLTLGTGALGNGITLGDVKFDVELTNPLHFHQTNGLDAFMFNYSGIQALSFYNITAGYKAPTNSGGPFHEDGAGAFGYIVQYGTQPAVDGQSLMFTAHAALPLLLSSFELLHVGAGGASLVDFAANVSNGACTGLIGGGNGILQSTAQTKHSGGSCTAPPPGVPEPSSVLLLGTVLAVVGKVLKARLVV